MADLNENRIKSKNQPETAEPESCCTVDHALFKSVWLNKFAELERDPSKARRLVSIKARLKESQLKEVETAGGSRFFSDEAKEHGGEDSYPRPLDYFLAGLALCEMSFYVRNSSLFDIPLDSLEISVEGEMDLRDRITWLDENGNLQFSGYPSGFKIIRTVTRIRSKVGNEKIKKLVESVYQLCTAYNSLMKPIPIDSKIIYNGEELLGSDSH